MARPSKPWFRASKNAWYVKVNGKMTPLGVKGEENEADAVTAWHRLMGGVEPTPQPRAIAPAQPAVKAEPTVAEIIGLFLADAESRVKAKTLAWYRDFLGPFAEQHGTLAASALAPTTAEAYSRKAEWSPSTRHDFLGTLASAFKWAERARLIDRTPLLGLRRPVKASRGAEALVTPEEHARLCEAATPWFRLFLIVAYSTGARPGEVAAITAANFDAEAGLVRLKDHKTAHKGKARVLYLTPEIVALLMRQRDRYPTGPLLRNRNGKPWNCWAIVKAMEVTRERAGIPHAVTYGLRHSFATDALANGVPDAQVAELLGHSGTAMLHKHYSHLGARSQVLREALGKVRAG
jgi:integrase